MIEGRDASCSHSHQYFSVRDLRFWNIYEFQLFITTEFFALIACMLILLLQMTVTWQNHAYACILQRGSGSHD